MAGIQYSTARTDATHAEATGALPFPIEPSRQAGRAPNIVPALLIATALANLRSAAAKNRRQVSSFTRPARGKR
jgi:hypothetical protein